MGNKFSRGSRSILGAFALLTMVVVGAPVAQAVPALQLDIAGGFYDTTTQTILTSDNRFSLYALLNTTDARVSPSDTYFISVALTPMTSTSASLGSFTFNGTNVNVTSDMTYGVPPLELSGAADFDPGDLAPHDVYPTYFREFAFTFNPLNSASIYNTATTPGGITANMGGTGLLYAAFTVDRSLLSSPYQLHFDLYNESIINRTNRQGVVFSTDIDVNKFAPFSHDAGTTRRGVPEPSAALLMGVGVLGFGLWQWRRASQSV